MSAKVKDIRCVAVAPLIYLGVITDITSLFKFIPKTVVAQALGTNNNRFTGMIQNPDKFSLEEIEEICRYLGIDRATWLDLTDNEKRARKGLPRRKISMRTFKQNHFFES